MSVDSSSLSPRSSSSVQKILNIYPRLCTLHKWSHFKGYGIHLSYKAKSFGLRIDNVEPNSPAESGGIRCNDVVLGVNGFRIKNDDFIAILSFIQRELEQDQIRFLVLDAKSAELVKRYEIHIDENNDCCIQIEAAKFNGIVNNSINNQYRSPNSFDQTMLLKSSCNRFNNINEVSPNSGVKKNTSSSPRLCPVNFRPDVDKIGILLQYDPDFGHIIKEIEPDSPAHVAGISSNDCIIAINDTILIYKPVHEIIDFLKNSSNGANLDFLVAKKSYLLQSYRNYLPASNSIVKTPSYSNIIENNKSSKSMSVDDVPESGDKTTSINSNKRGKSEILQPTPEKLSNATNEEDNVPLIKKRNSGSTTRLNNGSGSTGVLTSQQIVPNGTEQQTPNSKSIQTTINDQRKDVTEIKPYNDLQKDTGSPSQRDDKNVLLSQQKKSGVLFYISTVTDSLDKPCSSQPPLSDEQCSSVPKSTPLPSKVIQNNGTTVSSLPLKHDADHQNAMYITPIQSSSTNNLSQQDDSSKSSSNLRLATLPISELSSHGYELHNVILIKPSEAIPIGFKLLKQADPLQYIITIVVENTKAGLDGLQINDWLIKLNDIDIRLIDLDTVSQEVERLFNSAGAIKMLVARKKSTISPIVAERQTLHIYDNSNAQVSTVTPDSVRKEIKSQEMPEKSVNWQLNDVDQDKVRRIVLLEASGLDFHSFVPDNNQTQIHFVSNIQLASTAYKVGLRDGDCILAVNGFDITNSTHENVRSMILSKPAVELTVLNDPKYLKLIKTIKCDQNKRTSQSTNSMSKEQRCSTYSSKNSISALFTDDEGSVYIKNCTLKKDSKHNSFGFVLRYTNCLHMVDDVKVNFPAHKCGLSNNDVILFVNKQNAEEMTHDAVKMLMKLLVKSNEAIDLILMNKDFVNRYRKYKEKYGIDWNKIIFNEQEDSLDQIQPERDRNHQINESDPAAPPSMYAGCRICLLETSECRTAGFVLSGMSPPPYKICKIAKDSPAEKAGLQVDDILISVNEKSVTDKNYKDTIEIIRAALQQKTVQLTVIEQTVLQENESKRKSRRLTGDDNDSKVVHSTVNSTGLDEQSEMIDNVVRQFQKQRCKELSYTLRLCHLNATNTDGTPATTFGFEVTEDSEYDYPVISRIEPKLPAERAGIKTQDILLKINNRKTKGLNFDKVRKAIEKAKRDGRLEILVVDKEAFHYCKKTNKKFKEPDIKVKHIFPKQKPIGNYLKLPAIAAASSRILQDNSDRLPNGVSTFKVHRLSIPVEMHDVNIENNTIPPEVQLTLDPNAPVSNNSVSIQRNLQPPEVPVTSLDSLINLPQQATNSSADQSVSNNKQRKHSQTSADQSIKDFISNTINTFFHNIGSQKSTKPGYEIPVEQAVYLREQIRSSTLISHHDNSSECFRDITQSNNTLYSHQPHTLYDYIREPRRCLLRVERGKGLGFILSATDDYVHTITSIEKDSIADISGLQVNDEIIEVNGVYVRNIKYEQVIDMLISAMRSHSAIEISVVNSHSTDTGLSISDIRKGTNAENLSNKNNNNNNNNNAAMGIHINNTLKIDQFNESKLKNSSNKDCDTSNKKIDSDLYGSLPVLSTGITASSKCVPLSQIFSTSSRKNSAVNIENVCKNDAPVARLCRIRKFSSSPFYGFYLHGDRKKLGRVFVSNVTKNSSAALCGLREGDHVIEVNGTSTETLTYEAILNHIKLHMECQDLELLVLDKKSSRWYHQRNFPITSQTLPTIVHIEPHLRASNSDAEHFTAVDTDTKQHQLHEQWVPSTSI